MWGPEEHEKARGVARRGAEGKEASGGTEPQEAQRVRGCTGPRRRGGPGRRKRPRRQGVLEKHESQESWGTSGGARDPGRLEEPRRRGRLQLGEEGNGVGGGWGAAATGKGMQRLLAASEGKPPTSCPVRTQGDPSVPRAPAGPS